MILGLALPDLLVTTLAKCGIMGAQCSRVPTKARAIEQKPASLDLFAPVIDGRRGGLGVWRLLRSKARCVEGKEGGCIGGKRSTVSSPKMRA